MNDKLTIKETAKLLNVSIDTLRRWDKSNKLKAARNQNGRIYYNKTEIDGFLMAINRLKLARKWLLKSAPAILPDLFYCRDSYVFQGRMSRLENQLSLKPALKDFFSLITAVAGEIGNNSFDHNFGNWPDTPGIFFSYDLAKGEIILADRGQGVLQTLRKVRPGLIDDTAALRVAFLEILSGRSPESRGNGLKFVLSIVTKYPLRLFFQSGEAQVKLSTRNKKLKIKPARQKIKGCLAIINF